MREYRVTLQLASALGTPLLADTIFGHICWALKYVEGEDNLRAFLAAYDEEPPLLISDGFPVLGGRFYFPRPIWPMSKEAEKSLSQAIGVDESNRALYRAFLTAWRAIEKKPYIEQSVLAKHAEPLDMTALARECFDLQICPKSMAPMREGDRPCDTWQDCPELEAGKAHAECKVEHLRKDTKSIFHNVVNRWSATAVELFTHRDTFVNHDFYFMVKASEDIMPSDRLERVLEYIRHTGYGRDKTTGRGAVASLEIEEVELPAIPGANGFLNLSSAYVPTKGQLGKGFYKPHVKYGKLGGDYVLNHMPWKRPVVMLRSGSVFLGDPKQNWGCLVKNVHYELPEVVQYGYAYPWGVKLDECAFSEL